MLLRSYRSIVAAALLSVTTISYAQTPEPKAEADTDAVPINQRLPLEDLRLFTQVFDQIRTGYVKPVDDSELLENAIRGMLSELDPHSSYLDAESFGSLKESTNGEFGGLGIEITSENGLIKVVSPIDDTPAEKAGIKSGDLIVEINGRSTKGVSVGQATQIMRGAINTDIKLTIFRKGQKKPMNLTLKRAAIKVTSIRSDLIDPHYGYLRIAQFQTKTGRDFSRAIKKLTDKSKQLKGLVIDLRNNPGGILQASVEVVDSLIDEGLVVYTEGRLENTSQKYFAKDGDETGGLPIVVLINDGSASASEIVAGALQDQGRAIIMGTRSFGKGSVQTVVPLSENKAIKLTTALYFTPNGRSIQAQGIEPDIIVERAEVKTLKTGKKRAEADLFGHIGNGNGGRDITSKDKTKNTLHPRLTNDNQLHTALSLLKGISVLDKNKSTTATAQ